MSPGNESERAIDSIGWIVAGLRERAVLADSRGDHRMARGDFDDAGTWYERARISRWLATGIADGTVLEHLQHAENQVVIAGAEARA